MSWDRFDSAVVLLGDDPGTEAQLRLQALIRKLAEHLPVIVGLAAGRDFTVSQQGATGTSRVRVERLPDTSERAPSRDCGAWLRSLGVARPLLLIANADMVEPGLRCFSPLRVGIDFGGRDRWLDDPPKPLSEQLDLTLIEPAAGDDVAGARVPCGSPSDRIVAGDIDAWMEAIAGTARRPADERTCLETLVLYDAHSVHVSTIREHVESFALHSRHRAWYAHAAYDADCALDLDAFDAVVIHYSCRICFPHFFSPSYYARLREYAGLKVLFIQDEYDSTHNAWKAIEELGIQVVFTCVPERSIPRIYPRERFPHVRFVPTLTGYVPRRLQAIASPRPLRERSLVIGYRGRSLGFWYGELAREKVTIAERMKAICTQRGIPADIEWDERSRVYGDQWYEFLSNCRATLGTESGANLFDWDGSRKEAVMAELARNPHVSFEEIYERHLRPHDHVIQMNQVSPRIFEAIAVRTALVLFEGEYSGVIQPDRHYIPLKKDFSNIDEVLERLRDDAELLAMTQRAYDEVVASGRYDYASFVRQFDLMLESELGCGVGRRLVGTLTGPARHQQSVVTDGSEPSWPTFAAVAGPRPMQLPAFEPIFLTEAPRWFLSLRLLARRIVPRPIRQRLKPPIRSLVVRTQAFVRRIRGR